uniref:ANK_REP_REGION domain-containing protein n=1 Tax=Macrostomum lignano TaxID=282301 RepID=A0A1I8FF56_9PLAT
GFTVVKADKFGRTFLIGRSTDKTLTGCGAEAHGRLHTKDGVTGVHEVTDYRQETKKWLSDGFRNKKWLSDGFRNKSGSPMASGTRSGLSDGFRNKKWLSDGFKNKKWLSDGFRNKKWLSDGFRNKKWLSDGFRNKVALRWLQEQEVALRRLQEQREQKVALDGAGWETKGGSPMALGTKSGSPMASGTRSGSLDGFRNKKWLSDGFRNKKWLSDGFRNKKWLSDGFRNKKWLQEEQEVVSPTASGTRSGSPMWLSGTRSGSPTASGNKKWLSDGFRNKKWLSDGSRKQEVALRRLQEQSDSAYLDSKTYSPNLDLAAAAMNGSTAGDTIAMTWPVDSLWLSMCLDTYLPQCVSRQARQSQFSLAIRASLTDCSSVNSRPSAMASHVTRLDHRLLGQLQGRQPSREATQWHEGLANETPDCKPPSSASTTRPQPGRTAAGRQLLASKPAETRTRFGIETTEQLAAQMLWWNRRPVYWSASPTLPCAFESAADILLSAATYQDRKRQSPVAVKADVQHRVVTIESVLNSVAVMHVPDKYAAYSIRMPSLSVTSRHHYIVDEAEASRLVGFCVMPRRAELLRNRFYCGRSKTSSTTESRVRQLLASESAGRRSARAVRRSTSLAKATSCSGVSSGLYSTHGYFSLVAWLEFKEFSGDLRCDISGINMSPVEPCIRRHFQYGLKAVRQFSKVSLKLSTARPGPRAGDKRRLIAS